MIHHQQDNQPGDLRPLLRPVTLGGLELPNRVVMAPATRCRADPATLTVTDRHAAYYAQRASAGLIVAEGTWVSEGAVGDYPCVPGIYTAAQVAAAVQPRVQELGQQVGAVGGDLHPVEAGLTGVGGGRVGPAPGDRRHHHPVGQLQAAQGDRPQQRPEVTRLVTLLLVDHWLSLPAVLSVAWAIKQTDGGTER